MMRQLDHSCNRVEQDGALTKSIFRDHAGICPPCLASPFWAHLLLQPPCWMSASMYRNENGARVS